MHTLRALGWLVAGLACGFFAGFGWSAGYVEHENGTTDLMPVLGDWPVVWGVLLALWSLALTLAVGVRRVRWLALGWVIGFPLIPAITWIYAWHTFGTWGEVPLP